MPQAYNVARIDQKLKIFRILIVYLMQTSYRSWTEHMPEQNNATEFAGWRKGVKQTSKQIRAFKLTKRFTDLLVC